jgi:hypothetical protein
MGGILAPKPPKVDTSAQDAQIATQKAEAERLTTEANAKKRAALGRTGGSKSLLTGLETGVSGLKSTLG